MTSDITGRLIRQWRVNHGVTLSQAAKEAGVSTVELGEVERGLVPVSEAVREWWERKLQEGEK